MRRPERPFYLRRRVVLGVVGAVVALWLGSVGAVLTWALEDDARKADAVKASVDGDMSPMKPASILQTHANTTLYLDRDCAALLASASRGEILESDES